MVPPSLFSDFSKEILMAQHNFESSAAKESSVLSLSLVIRSSICFWKYRGARLYKVNMKLKYKYSF